MRSKIAMERGLKIIKMKSRFSLLSYENIKHCCTIANTHKTKASTNGRNVDEKRNRKIVVYRIGSYHHHIAHSFTFRIAHYHSLWKDQNWKMCALKTYLLNTRKKRKRERERIMRQNNNIISSATALKSDTS